MILKYYRLLENTFLLAFNRHTVNKMADPRGKPVYSKEHKEIMFPVNSSQIKFAATNQDKQQLIVWLIIN